MKMDVESKNTHSSNDDSSTMKDVNDKSDEHAEVTFVPLERTRRHERDFRIGIRTINTVLSCLLIVIFIAVLLILIMFV